MRIAPEQLEQIVAHALREAPNECVGLLRVRGDRVVEVHEAENVERSPLRFEVDGLELARVLDAWETAGDQLGVIYHSHTRSAPAPSMTDVNFAAGWPGVEWLIVGVSRDGGTEVRHWRIEDGEVSEAPLEVG